MERAFPDGKVKHLSPSNSEDDKLGNSASFSDLANNPTSHCPWVGRLLESWTRLDKLLDGTAEEPHLILMFDEAHELTRRNIHDPAQTWSMFGELRAALRVLRRQHIFTVFLSTTGSFSQFTPLPEDDISARVPNEGLQLIPPYCDLGFDLVAIHSGPKVKLDGSWTLAEVTTDEHMSRYGRPL